MNLMSINSVSFEGKKIPMDKVCRSRIRLSNGCTAIIDEGLYNDNLVKLTGIIASKGKKVKGLGILRDRIEIDANKAGAFFDKLSNFTGKCEVNAPSVEETIPVEKFGKFDIIG